MSIARISRDKIRILWILSYIGSAIIAFRLIDIQLLRHRYYMEAAEKNRTQIIYQTAPRGRIITRDGLEIATSLPSFSLIYLPGRFSDPSYLRRLAEDFAPKLNVTPGQLFEKIQKAFENGTPVRLAESLSTKSMFAFSELRTLYPGVDLVVETKRYYPYGNFASHLIGYMSKMDQRDWKQLRQERGDYRLDSKVGKSGLERMFEQQLKGKDGGLYLEIDWKGKLKRVLQSRPWEAGADLRLTLNAKMQKAAEDGLKTSLSGKGAVVAVNPRNGDILAIASSPGFDPNIFVAYSDSDVGTELTKTLPEYNLAIQGLYAPASTFKILVTAAALESGKLSPDEKFLCTGSFNAGGRTFKCWEKKGHGHMNLIEGLAHSCDVYYYNAGLRIGAGIIEQFQNAFRFGQLTGIPFPGEKSGRVFGPVERERRHGRWFSGDTLNLSIGQGELLVTPIQLAQMVAVVANGGFFWRPQYVENVTSVDNTVLFQKKPELLGALNLKPETWTILRDALKAVVEEGTGQAAKIKGVNVYGKTGTAQNPHGDDNAWFVAYAEVPGKKAEVAVCVLVQHGKHGASAAAPIAKNVIMASLGMDVNTTDLSGSAPAETRPVEDADVKPVPAPSLPRTVR